MSSSSVSVSPRRSPPLSFHSSPPFLFRRRNSIDVGFVVSPALQDLFATWLTKPTTQSFIKDTLGELKVTTSSSSSSSSSQQHEGLSPMILVTPPPASSASSSTHAHSTTTITTSSQLELDTSTPSTSPPSSHRTSPSTSPITSPSNTATTTSTSSSTTSSVGTTSIHMNVTDSSQFSNLSELVPPQLSGITFDTAALHLDPLLFPSTSTGSTDPELVPTPLTPDAILALRAQQQQQQHSSLSSPSSSSSSPSTATLMFPAANLFADRPNTELTLSPGASRRSLHSPKHRRSRSLIDSEKRNSPASPSGAGISTSSLSPLSTSASGSTTPPQAPLSPHSHPSSFQLNSMLASPPRSPSSLSRSLAHHLTATASASLLSQSAPGSGSNSGLASPKLVPASPPMKPIRRFYFPDGPPQSPATQSRQFTMIRTLFQKAAAGMSPAEAAAATSTNTTSTPTTNTTNNNNADDTPSTPKKLDKLTIDHNNNADTLMTPVSTAVGSPSPSIPDDELALTVQQLFVITTQVCQLPSYTNSSLFQRLQRYEHEKKDTSASTTSTTTTASSVSTTSTTTTTEGNTDASAARVSFNTFLSFWQHELASADSATRLFRILRANCNVQHLVRSEFTTMVREVVDRHPGLEFLEATPEFQDKYAETVIARIFYRVNSSGTDKMTARELKQSNFLDALGMLDVEDDINKIHAYFSYEHFYVVYCKFWQLDDDHDGYLSLNDLLRYDDYALTQRVCERVMQCGGGRKLLSAVEGYMNYIDFAVFLMSEVDKQSDVSIDYWFNVLDVDGDGVLTPFELQYFFDEQQVRMQQISQEQIHFNDILCQLVDMVKRPAYQESARSKNDNNTSPQKTSVAVGQASNSTKAINYNSVSFSVVDTLSRISSTVSAHRNVHNTSFSRADLKQSGMSSLFFNILFNLSKFIIHEQRDPIRAKHVHDTPHLSDWDRYAIATYYQLSESDLEQEAANSQSNAGAGGSAVGLSFHEDEPDDIIGTAGNTELRSLGFSGSGMEDD